MARFMISGVLLFSVAYYHAPPFNTHQYLIFCKLKIGHIDFVLHFPCSNKRCLVHKIGKVCSGKSRGPPCDLIEIDILGNRDILCMYFEYLKTPFHVRGRHDYLPVESPGSQEGWIEDIRPVGGSYNNHALVPFETVHFNEQLVQGLLPLVVTAAETS